MMQQGTHRPPPRLGLTALLGILATTVAFLFPTPAASAVEPGWQLRVNGFWFDPDGRFEVTDEQGASFRADTEAGVGGGINAEYRFSPRFGVEVGAFGGAEADAFWWTGSFSGSVSFSGACTGLNVHLTPDGEVDLYVGPLVAYVHYSDMVLGTAYWGWGTYTGWSGVVRVDDDFAWGASLGLDVPVGSGGWLFNANLRYLLTSLDTTAPDGARDSVDFDPLMVGMGFGYRF